MIVEPTSKLPEQPPAPSSPTTTTATAPAAGPSAAAPEQSNNNEFDYPDIVFPGPDGQPPLGPPPAFTPYDADWFEVGKGDVVSHDEHLNTDGEALYRFLLTQAAQTPPRYRIHIRGSHTELRTRWRSGFEPYIDDGFPHHHHQHNDHHHNHHHHHSHYYNSPTGMYTRTDTYTDRVNDFDFCIDVVPPYRSPTPYSPPPLNVNLGKGAHATLPEAKDDPTAPVQWSVGDAEPAYRGKMVPEVELDTPPVHGHTGGAISLPGPDLPLPASANPHAHAGVRSDTHSSALTGTRTRRTAKRRERKSYDQWAEMRTRKGLPPWVSGGSLGIWDSPPSSLAHPSENEILKSSKTVREWADEYCASRKLLKEFVYTKVLYGWDTTQLESAIRTTITQAPYLGDISVTFTPIASRIYIRPSNTLSRLLSRKWLKFLTVILFIFPFIWLFKRFHPRGGGRWEVCGGAYALKKWVPVVSPDEQERSAEARPSGSGSRNGADLPSYEDVAGPSSSISSPQSHLQSPISVSSGLSPSMPSTNSNPIMRTPQGTFRLLGQREGDWFRVWQPTILRAVLMRYVSLIPLTVPASGGDAPGSLLDGYWDAGLAGASANQNRGQLGHPFGVTPMIPGGIGMGVGGPGYGVGGGLGVGTVDGRVYF